jgi:UDP-N-acetylglucosamine--N-acetylmuramyl-(pentapeptide) pyrophosphoryl-undecaprenol N-acetylglucosamine transferase
MRQPHELRCLIAAGGTAGHVLPSLAVADALKSRGVTVTFAGSPERAEARLVPDAGYELDSFRVAGFPRRPSLALARALMLAGKAPIACAQILRRRQPDVVLGGGGYVAGPMVFAAASLRIPAAVMEADAHLGLANRLAAPFAERVFLSFPIPDRVGDKYLVTGRPIPARSHAPPQLEARRLFDLPETGPVLLVFGGSLGARLLNDIAVDAWGTSGPPVLHLCGERDYDDLVPRVRRRDYRLLAFTDDIGAAYGACDLVFARAGGSVWELAAAAKPAILVPGEFATADHQSKNARYFAAGGGAVVVEESEARARVPELVQSLLESPLRLGEMSAAMRRLAKPDAADVIAEGLIGLAA